MVSGVRMKEEKGVEVKAKVARVKMKMKRGRNVHSPFEGGICLVCWRSCAPVYCAFSLASVLTAGHFAGELSRFRVDPSKVDEPGEDE